MSNPSGNLDPNLQVNCTRLNKRKTLFLQAISCSVALAILTVATGTFFLYFRHLKKPKQCSSPRLPLLRQMANSESKISSFSVLATAHSHGFSQVLSFTEICQATKNFDETLLTGVNGFGKVL